MNHMFAHASWNEATSCRPRSAVVFRSATTTSPSALSAPTHTSEEFFRSEASDHPKRLLRYLTHRVLDAADTGLAAELAGELLPAKDVVNVLVRVLSSHPSPIAREGSVYGLAHHREAYNALKNHLPHEKSSAVREAIADVLAACD